MNENSKISVNKDISIAQTLPSYFYTSEDIFIKSIDNIFKKSWQFVTHKKLIQKKIYPFFFMKGLINDPYILISENNLNTDKLRDELEKQSVRRLKRAPQRIRYYKRSDKNS